MHICRIGSKNSSLIDIKNKNYLSHYDIFSLEIQSSDTIIDIVNKIPNNSELTLWINDKTVYGKQIMSELFSLDPSFFGYLNIKWMYDRSTIFFHAFRYDNAHTYQKTYTKINGEKWGNWIKIS